MLEQRDIIVVGASAGGLDALARLVPDLPRDLGAAVFLVVHTPPHEESFLPQILTRWGPLKASHAIDGEPIQRGHIYVAPPNRHLVIGARQIHVALGPRENFHRPAVDPLFRSAADAHGPCVIGVVLSGSRDDGAAGLASVKAAGGVAVVQDPEDAVIPGMPRSALEVTDVDHILPAAALAPLLVRLVKERLDVPAARALGGDGEEEVASASVQPPPGGATLSCPECGGVLQESHARAGGIHYRCRVGHAFSEQALLTAQAETLETALWAALQALEDRQDIARRIAERARREGRPQTMALFEGRERDAGTRAELIRAVLLGNGGVGGEVEKST